MDEYQRHLHEAVQHAKAMDLIDEMPFVVFAKKTSRTFVDFKQSLKYDNEEGYVFKEIYPIFCTRMVKDIVAGDPKAGKHEPTKLTHKPTKK
jgi:hypothetical protein